MFFVCYVRYIVEAQNAVFLKLLSFLILEYYQYFLVFGRNIFSAMRPAAGRGRRYNFPQWVYFFLLLEDAVFAIIAL